MPIYSKLSATVVNFVIVLDILLLIIETSGVLSLSGDNVKLSIKIDPPLVFVKVDQSISLLAKSPRSVLFEMFVHHTIINQFFNKLQMLLFLEVSRRR